MTGGSLLLPAPRGGPHGLGDVLEYLCRHDHGADLDLDPVEVLNQLAAWLDARWVSVLTAVVMQAVTDAVAAHVGPADAAHVGPAARRWISPSAGTAPDAP